MKAIKNKLNARDRDFFRIVAKSAFSNPFGAGSLQLSNTIAGGEYKNDDIHNFFVFVSSN